MKYCHIFKVSVTNLLEQCQKPINENSRKDILRFTGRKQGPNL